MSAPVTQPRAILTPTLGEVEVRGISAGEYAELDLEATVLTDDAGPTHRRAVFLHALVVKRGLLFPAQPTLDAVFSLPAPDVPLIFAAIVDHSPEGVF